MANKGGEPVPLFPLSVTPSTLPSLSLFLSSLFRLLVLLQPLLSFSLSPSLTLSLPLSLLSSPATALTTMADTTLTLNLNKAETHSSLSDIEAQHDEKAAIRDRQANDDSKDAEVEATPPTLAKKMLIMCVPPFSSLLQTMGPALTDNTHTLDPPCCRDIRLIVWFLIVFLLSFFWRSNIGSGALAAITPDLKLPIADYDKGIAVFFVCFIVWSESLPLSDSDAGRVGRRSGLLQCMTAHTDGLSSMLSLP